MSQYHIIFEDKSIIVIDKPSGMLVIPTPKGETNTLSHLINDELNSRGEEVNAYPCHRIDRETSGLIIFAKGKKNQQEIMKQFEERLVKKSYIAFIHGSLRQDHGVLKSYGKSKYDNYKRLMITQYRVVTRRPGFTVVKAKPITGRTNQLRIQFKEISHPILGESVYAFRKDFSLKFRRLALHSYKISFVHPMTKELVEYTSEIPEDMKGLL